MEQILFNVFQAVIGKVQKFFLNFYFLKKKTAKNNHYPKRHILGSKFCSHSALNIIYQVHCLLYKPRRIHYFPLKYIFSISILLSILFSPSGSISNCIFSEITHMVPVLLRWKLSNMKLDNIISLPLRIHWPDVFVSHDTGIMDD